MRLYTVQPISIYNQLLENGVFYAQPQLDPNSFLSASEDFKIPMAYDWICQRMIDKGLERPKGDVFPIWGYVHWAGPKRSKPDLRSRQIKSWTKDTQQVLMTLDVPAEEVLVFDYGLWVYCLSYSYIGTVRESEGFDRRCRKQRLALWRDEPFPQPIHEELLSSWDTLFNLERSRRLRRLKRDNHDIQATLWNLRKENVVSAVEFGGGGKLVEVW